MGDFLYCMLFCMIILVLLSGCGLVFGKLYDRSEKIKKWVERMSKVDY